MLNRDIDFFQTAYNLVAVYTIVLGIKWPYRI